MAAPYTDPVMEAASELATALGHTGLFKWEQVCALDRLLDVHAHELAEKIRLARAEMDRPGNSNWGSSGMGMAADLIDPEVTKS